MSRTTSKQGNKSGWKRRDAKYRQEQHDRAKVNRTKRQVINVFTWMARWGR